MCSNTRSIFIKYPDHVVRTPKTYASYTRKGVARSLARLLPIFARYLNKICQGFEHNVQDDRKHAKIIYNQVSKYGVIFRGTNQLFHFFYFYIFDILYLCTFNIYIYIYIYIYNLVSIICLYILKR